MLSPKLPADRLGWVLLRAAVAVVVGGGTGCCRDSAVVAVLRAETAGQSAAVGGNVIVDLSWRRHCRFAVVDDDDEAEAVVGAARQVVSPVVQVADFGYDYERRDGGAA